MATITSGCDDWAGSAGYGNQARDIQFANLVDWKIKWFVVRVPEPQFDQLAASYALSQSQLKKPAASESPSPDDHFIGRRRNGNVGDRQLLVRVGILRHHRTLEGDRPQ